MLEKSASTPRIVDTHQVNEVFLKRKSQSPRKVLTRITSKSNVEIPETAHPSPIKSRSPSKTSKVVVNRACDSKYLGSSLKQLEGIKPNQNLTKACAYDIP